MRYVYRMNTKPTLPSGVAAVVEPWTCDAHGITTTGDRPKCDDEMIAGWD